MDTTLPGHAAEIAAGVGETAKETIDKGRDRTREIMVTAEEHLPDSAVDWTREHVPGLVPRRRAAPRPPRVAVVIALIIVIVALVCWLRRSSGGADLRPIRDTEPDPDREPENPAEL